MKCPICKTGTLRAWKGVRRFDDLEVQATGQACSECGEILIAGEEVERIEKAFAAQMVGRGIRNGRELLHVRKVAGFRAIDLAELLDVDPKTVSRWEKGEVEIPRAVAFAVGELYDRPRVVRAKLEAFATA